MGSSKAGAGRLGRGLDMEFDDQAKSTPIGSGCHDDDRSGSLIRRVRVSREGETKKDAALKGGATKTFSELKGAQDKERCRPKGRRYETLGVLNRSAGLWPGIFLGFPGRQPSVRRGAEAPPIHCQGTGKGIVLWGRTKAISNGIQPYVPGNGIGCFCVAEDVVVISGLPELTVKSLLIGEAGLLLKGGNKSD